MITLENNCGHKVSMVLVKYDYEKNYTDDKFFKYEDGQQKSIERYSGRKYFVIVNDIDYQYGFIVVGGFSYSYKGKGKMWNNNENSWVEFKMLEDRPGQIGFYAILSDFKLYLEGERISVNEKASTFVYRQPGKYVIGYDSNYQNIIDKYAVESGISYYVAMGQMIVECNTNIILKPYKQGETHDPKPTKKEETNTNVNVNVNTTVTTNDGGITFKNGTGEEIQVAFSIDCGSNQSNKYYKLSSNQQDTWGRTKNRLYQCCVFYRNIIYNYIVEAGKSYVFLSSLKLIDLETNSQVSYGDLKDTYGYVAVRAINGNYSVSVSDGSEGAMDIKSHSTVWYNRPSGSYILTIHMDDGQDKKFKVSSGSSYIIWSSKLICYTTSIYVEIYTETTTTVVVQKKTGYIKMTNGISGKISVSIGKNEDSNQDSGFFALEAGNTDAWGRYYGDEYQCFILDPDSFTYGFIILGGGNYTYQGQGKLWDNDKNVLAEEDDLNLSTPGFVIVKAFRCNVTVSLSGGNNNTFTINQNQFVRFNRREGNHVLKFNDLAGNEKKYLVTTGRSYYIYNSGSCIDKDSNVVLPLYSEDKESSVVYDDEKINKIIEFNGGSSSWQQWSSSYSNKTHVSYSHTSSTHHSSNFQQSSHFSHGSNIRGLDMNGFQGMTGGKIIVSGFDQNSFQQFSGGMNVHSTNFSSSTSESFSSQTHFSSTNYLN